MIRQTSVDTYKQIRDSGLLNGLRFEVYDYLFFHGPATQMETCRGINNSHRQDRSYMPRFAELEKMGVIEAIGTSICDITHREVMTWNVTGNLPIKLEKKPEAETRYICEDCSMSFKEKVSVHPGLETSLSLFDTVHRRQCYGKLYLFKLVDNKKKIK